MNLQTDRMGKKNTRTNKLQIGTLPETNSSHPKNGWLEYDFPIGEAYFQGLC